jgi:hypothetical protein
MGSDLHPLLFAINYFGKRKDELVEDKDSTTELFLWEMKARPPPKPSTLLVTMHFDYSDSQISFADSFYAAPDYPIDSYLS